MRGRKRKYETLEDSVDERNGKLEMQLFSTCREARKQDYRRFIDRYKNKASHKVVEDRTGSKYTVSNVLASLVFWDAKIEPEYDSLTPDTLELLVQDAVAGLPPTTRNARCGVLKTFLKRINKPDLAKGIELVKTKTKIKIEELVSPDDVMKMLNACMNPRDRALISLIYESGARRGEILRLAICDATPEPDGYRIRLNGKTGTRRILVIDSAQFLHQWLTVHPCRADPQAPIFCTLGDGKRQIAVSSLNLCTGPSCIDMIEKDMSDKYFRKEYTKAFSEATFIHAEEHSGQIDGDTRKDLEVRFREKGDVNVIVCTPTMELGIDIGSLSAVYMRNVPPSPSNYAQRAGRAGRKSQSSMISTFCGVGMKRGPHDQYFYRYPKDIISGKISVPRFMLNNQTLVRSHIHSLIIESLTMKIPQKLSQIIDMDVVPTLPMFSDIDKSLNNELIDKNEVSDLVVSNRRKIIDTIKQAMSTEINAFDWFTDKYIEDIVDMFVTDLDDAFNPFRKDFIDLNNELHDVGLQIRNHNLDHKKKQTYKARRESIESKIDKMQSGSDEYATYSYLSQQGFIPNYGFPTLTTILSLRQRKGREDKDLVRDQSKALREYAPGNSIYYRGTRYVVKEARIKTLNNKIESSKLLICENCGVAYLDADIIASCGCCQYCGADLSDNTIFNNAITMLDQRAIENNGITSDEEERYRLGYNISSHYKRSNKISNHSVMNGTDVLMSIGYDHDGKILEVNEGPVSKNEDNDVNGFILCAACNRWITSKNQLKEHLDDKNSNKCWKGAKQDDIVENIVLYTESKHDVVSIDCEPPADIGEDDYYSFYVSLSEAIMQSLQITMNIDVDELQSFLMPHPDDEKRHVIIIYESAEGGAGILKALTGTSTFRAVMKEGRKILHENDPAGKACIKACYLCLCNYYNQRVHDHLDRNLVLPTLQLLSGSDVQKSLVDVTNKKYSYLMAKCDSSFEKEVLEAIRAKGVKLPDDAQYLIVVDRVGIAKPDFVYTEGRSIAIFVDGPDHDKESVKKDDEAKRQTLDLSGWLVFVIRYDDNIEAKMAELKRIIG